MDIVKELCDYFQSKLHRKFVATSDLKETFRLEEWDFDCTFLNDARSAAFYAYGQAKIMEAPVVLIVDGNRLADCYTGIVEAWFQQVHLIIISVAGNNIQANSVFLKEYVKDTIFLSEGDDITKNEKLYTCLNILGPILILCNNQKMRKAMNVLPHNLFEILGKYEKEKGTTIFLYCDSYYDNSGGHFKIVPIDMKYKYGAVSKYLGYIEGASINSYLVVPLELYTYDINVFNSRYVNVKAKIIFYNKSDMAEIPFHWFENNGFLCIRANGLDDTSIRTLVESEKQAILIIDKE